MNHKELSVFNFNGSQLRVFGSDEKPMFLAKEVGELLGLANIHYNLSTLDEDEKATISITESGQIRYKTTITESGIYKLVFRSRKEEALQFQNWVCKEVLPSIRRTGKYQLEQKLENTTQQIEEMKDTIEELQHLAANRNDQITISERMVYLGYIDRIHVPYLLNEHRGPHNIEMYHPDRKKFIKNIATISKRMSRAKRDTDGTYPMINRAQRNNMYFLTDYIRFGDTIIHAYFLERPFEEWGIDLTFQFPEFEIIE